MRHSKIGVRNEDLKSIARVKCFSSLNRTAISKIFFKCGFLLCLFLQTVILENEDLPKIFLDFLNVRHVPTLPKAESCG